MKRLGCHAGRQEVSRCRTRGESEESVACRQPKHTKEGIQHLLFGDNLNNITQSFNQLFFFVKCNKLNLLLIRFIPTPLTKLKLIIHISHIQ